MFVMVFMLSLVACGTSEKNEDITTKTTTEETTLSASGETTESRLLNELLAVDTYLGLMDGEYADVVDYISREPDETVGSNSYWDLEEGYQLRLNAYRNLTLEKGDYWSKELCDNIDNPNKHPAWVGMTVINDCTFDEYLNYIKVWKLGREIFEVELPSSEIEIVGTLKHKETWQTIIRSDSTIGVIFSDDSGKFWYSEVVSDCSGLIQMDQASVWYVDKEANLIHLNTVTTDSEVVAKNVTNLASVHDGTYCVGWREKGSLEWHEPEFYADSNGETHPWSEHGGM